MTDLPTDPDPDAGAQITIRTRITVDRELLEEAQRQISAESAEAAVNEALRRVVQESHADHGESAAAA